MKLIGIQNTGIAESAGMLNPTFGFRLVFKPGAGHYGIPGAGLYSWGWSIYLGLIFIPGVGLYTWGCCLYLGWSLYLGSVFIPGIGLDTWRISGAGLYTWGWSLYLGLVFIPGVGLYAWGWSLYLGLVFIPGVGLHLHETLLLSEEQLLTPAQLPVSLLQLISQPSLLLVQLKKH